MSIVVIEETVRRHFRSIWFYGFLGLIVIVAFAGARLGSASSLWPALIVLLAVVAGSAPIGPEFSSGTLQLILVKPVNRAVYLISRVAGVVLVVWLATLVAGASEAIGSFGMDLPLDRLGATLVNTMAESLLVVSVLTLIGSGTRAYFNVAVYFVLQIGIGVTLGFERKLPQAVTSVLRFVQTNVFADAPPRFDRDWLLLAVSNAVVAILLACLAFRRREVPYGAD